MTTIMKTSQGNIPLLCEAIAKPDPCTGNFFDEALLDLTTSYIATPIGRKILKIVIPTIDALRRAHPIQFSTMFAPQMLSEFGLGSYMNATDLTSSDTFFRQIPTKYVLLVFTFLAFDAHHVH